MAAVRAVRVRRVALAAAMTFAGLAAGAAAAGAQPHSRPAVTDPAKSRPANPDYYQDCAMSGIDTLAPCFEATLAAIDSARADEGLGPLRLPATFPSLPFDRQLLLVIDGERVARHLAPVVGISPALDRLAARGAAIDDLAPRPGDGYRGVRLDAAAGFSTVLDVMYQWMYNDGPNSDTNGCSAAKDAGCWADRHVILARFPAGRGLVMGAAVDPTGDTQSYDKGGPSLAIVLAQSTQPPRPLSFSWPAAQTLLRGRLLRARRAPLIGMSLTGIRDPAHTEPPNPDYAASCATTGLDQSPGCLDAILAAIDHARAAEGVKPMVLPPGFAQMTIPEQLLVTTNLERVDRGLPPFVGLSAPLDANAAKGADSADDPPDPTFVIGDDEEWSGGAVNALDADYGWMYDDGRGSDNLDCPRTGGPGCWGHREGILDAYGTVGTMVMGAAYNPSVKGETSMAMTLAAQPFRPGSYVVTWAQLDDGSG